jgi:hypothetical protein
MARICYPRLKIVKECLRQFVIVCQVNIHEWCHECILHFKNLTMKLELPIIPNWKCISRAIRLWVPNTFQVGRLLTYWSMSKFCQNTQINGVLSIN